jgi:hypothetical protein
VLPNFLIIGAMKAGTSSLYRYINDHPQVFMPERKELQFFGRADWRDRFEWYEDQFELGGSAVAVGEASTNYSKYPSIPDAADQIAQTIPHVKLIYVLRHPVDRAISQYLHEILHGRETRPIDIALHSDPHYLDLSRYAMQIGRYLEHFPRDRLLLVLSDELKHDRLATVQRVYAFLGVDADVVPPSIGQEFYRTEERRERHPRLQKVRHTRWYRPILDTVPLGVRRGVWRRVEPLATARVDRRRAEIAPELRVELEERLRGDVLQLKALLGPPFDGWGIA